MRVALFALSVTVIALAPVAAADGPALVSVGIGTQTVAAPTGASPHENVDPGVSTSEVTLLSIFGVPVNAPFVTQDHSPHASADLGLETTDETVPVVLIAFYAPAGASATHDRSGSYQTSVSTDANLDGSSDSAQLLTLSPDGSLSVGDCATHSATCGVRVPLGGASNAYASLIAFLPNEAQGGETTLLP